MVRNPDMVVGTIEGKVVKKPKWYKVFLFAGTDSKITKHECLYEGKIAYEKLENHVIICQITVKGKRKEGDTHKNIELTPISKKINPLKPRKKLLNSNKIWRYLSLSKFEDIINTNSLYFSRIDQFKDKLEGVSSFSSIKNIISDEQRNEEQKRETLRLYQIRMDNNRKVSFACCWHINENLNNSLWDEYGGNSFESIAIQTNVKKLNKVLNDTKLPVLNEPVQYFDEPYFNQNAYWFPTLFKRSEFEKEQELRSILFVHGFKLKGLKINIKPEELISKIYIHPNASKEFFKKIRLFIKDKGLKIPIAQKRPKNN